MTIEIGNILQEKDLKSIPKDNIPAINEAINTALSVKLKEMEDENSKKFSTLVENITKKFDEKVDTTITENLKTNTGNVINKKLYDIVKDVVNLLENSGITVTEKTKELHDKLKTANEKLEEVWKERENIKTQLNDATKENYILAQLKGMKPEIVNAAVEFFKDKDILDVQDQLQTFLDGDLSNIDLGEGDNELVGNINLDQVKDALEEIDTTKSKIDEKTEATKAKFESLAKGIKNRKVVYSPNITKDELLKSTAIVEGRETGIEEDDAKEALQQINDYNQLGYNFK
jgi:hypothetical protein